MASDDESFDATLNRYMGKAGDPPVGQVASSVEVVWERLRPEAECSPLPVREMVTRRSHFTAVAAVVVVTVAIGLYVAQRTGVLQAWLPVQQQAPPAPASPSAAVSVDPVRERVTITTSEPRQSTRAAVAEAALPQSRDIGPGPLRFTATPVGMPEGKEFMTSPEQLRSQGATIPATPLAFEVAAIRQVAPQYPTEGGPWTATNGRFSADHAWVRGVIAVAYDVNKAPLVKGGPDWIDQERYDIDARAGNAAAGLDQIRLMLQTLLTKRLKLAVHRSTEEAMVYTLVIAKNGTKLQAFKDGLLSSIKWSAPGKVTFSDARNLVGLTNVLGGVLGVPVFDETGLNGTYNFSLEFTDPRDPRPRTPDSPPDIFTAVQEQLGLELRATKRSVPVVVIDHIERPSPD